MNVCYNQLIDKHHVTGGNYWITKLILANSYQPAQTLVSELPSNASPLEKTYK